MSDFLKLGEIEKLRRARFLTGVAEERERERQKDALSYNVTISRRGVLQKLTKSDSCTPKLVHKVHHSLHIQMDQKTRSYIQLNQFVNLYDCFKLVLFENMELFHAFMLGNTSFCHAQILSLQNHWCQIRFKALFFGLV